MLKLYWQIKFKGDVLVFRYEGQGGPGMREMLKPTSAIMGLGLGVKRHLPAAVGFLEELMVLLLVMFLLKPLRDRALIQNGDEILIDAKNDKLTLNVSEEEIVERKLKWKNLFNLQKVF